MITTGGYDEAGDKVELYDCENNEIKELANMNEGRYRHACCQFNHQFVYAFSGR